MKATLFISFLALMLCQIGRAEDFTPPDAYPMNRYEAGWQRNPFTLKTAPPAVQRESFVKDLVLGGILQYGDTTTVTVVNTKTRVRTRLHDGQEGPGGLKIKSVHLDDRKDTFVELQQGTESAVLRYDEDFIKSLAAAHPTPGAKPGTPGGPMVASNNNMVGGPPVAPTGVDGSAPNGGNGGAAPFNRPPLPATNGAGAYVPTPTRRMLQTAPMPNSRH